MKRLAKQIIGLLLAALPIDSLFHLCQSLNRQLARLSFLREWRFGRERMPQFFRHEINMYQWRYRPELWSFTARGVNVRKRLQPGDKVLDLCCGDGSLGYLFYSDIAGRVDCIDADEGAIRYGRRHYARENIRYFLSDLNKQDLPAADYDWVVFNSGMYYFSETDLSRLLERLGRANKSGHLVGNVPMANGHADHKFEFKSKAELAAFLGHFYESTEIEEVAESGRTSFYFAATGARNP